MWEGRDGFFELRPWWLVAWTDRITKKKGAGLPLGGPAARHSIFSPPVSPTAFQAERSTRPPRWSDPPLPPDSSLERPPSERARSLRLLPVTGREVSCRVLSGTKGALATSDGAAPEAPAWAGTRGFVTCIHVTYRQN